MAVIFFDGFERTLDTNNWSGDTFAGSGAARPGGSAGSLIFSVASPAEAATLRNIGTHSGTKIYIGFGAYSIDAESTDGAAGRSFFEIYNDAQELRLSINISLTTEPDALNFVVRQSGATVDTYVIPDIASAQYINPGTNGYDPGWIFLELELDLLSAGQTLRLRHNGQTLTPVSGSGQFVSLSGSIDNVARLKFYGSKWNGTTAFDDLYIVDSTSPGPTTYLGTSASVLPVAVAQAGEYAQPAQWKEFYSSALYDGGEFPVYYMIGADDGDASNIQTSQLDQVYAFPVSAGYGGSDNDKIIGAIKISAVARKVSLDSSFKLVSHDTNTSTTYELGSANPLTNDAYTTITQLVTTNPETAAEWTVAEFNARNFGVKSVDPTTP